MDSKIENALPLLSSITSWRDKIALALCPLGFVVAAVISGIGWMVGLNTLPIALGLFWMIEAGALVLAIMARRQPLGKLAAIVSGASAGIGTLTIVALLAVAVSNGLERNSDVSTATMNHYSEMTRQPTMPANARPAASAQPSGYRSVYINSVRLTDMQVASIELSYGTRVPDGRFWVDAFGNFGFEGGPALGNLGAAGSQYGGGAGNGGGAVRKGPLSSYDVTGVAVYDLR